MSGQRFVGLEPPSGFRSIPQIVSWLNRVWHRFGNGAGPFPVQGFKKAALPDPAQWGNITGDDPFTSWIFVVDDVGGPTPAFSDGTSWRRVTDRAVIA